MTGVLAPFVTSTDPLRLCFRRDRWTFWPLALVSVGAILLAIFAISIAGWFGVIAMSRGFYGVLGSALSLLFGAMFSLAGAWARWGRVELEVEPQRLLVASQLGSLRRVREIVPGERVLVGIESARDEPLGDSAWLAVRASARAPLVRIAMDLRLDRAVLEALGALVVEWARASGATARFDSTAIAAAEVRARF